MKKCLNDMSILAGVYAFVDRRCLSGGEVKFLE